MSFADWPGTARILRALLHGNSRAAARGTRAVSAVFSTVAGPYVYELNRGIQRLQCDDLPGWESAGMRGAVRST